MDEEHLEYKMHRALFSLPAPSSTPILCVGLLQWSLKLLRGDT